MSTPGSAIPASNPAPNGAAPAARSTVLSLAIKEKAALYAAYMPYLKNGGIFVPTNKPYNLGDDVYLLLQLMDDPVKLPIPGKVVWITPAGAHNSKAQGIGVHFPSDATGEVAKNKIEAILGSAIKSTRQTHTI
ncbi:PilZ domain-containing protein [Parvibium lacunae]|uniref:Pilus assembly protein PilZ n=1 Tax=Parvibium lacunae TaxID=1888893 RepID=A0A368L8S6_9BURK|nr:PilZ domain-containing protein [Parvibium lacunae]RCS59629.1 pilus assembly protein PilZ [Parvibium lacunae]